MLYVISYMINIFVNKLKRIRVHNTLNNYIQYVSNSINN